MIIYLNYMKKKHFLSPTEDQRYSGPKAEIGLKIEIIFKIKKPRRKNLSKKK